MEIANLNLYCILYKHDKGISIYHLMADHEPSWQEVVSHFKLSYSDGTNGYGEYDGSHFDEVSVSLVKEEYLTEQNP